MDTNASVAPPQAPQPVEFAGVVISIGEAVSTPAARNDSADSSTVGEEG